mgnify:CR=1 FL=1|jgi:hypothetical protein
MHLVEGSGARSMSKQRRVVGLEEAPMLAVSEAARTKVDVLLPAVQ